MPFLMVSMSLSPLLPCFACMAICCNNTLRLHSHGLGFRFHIDGCFTHRVSPIVETQPWVSNLTFAICICLAAQIVPIRTARIDLLELGPQCQQIDTDNLLVQRSFCWYSLVWVCPNFWDRNGGGPHGTQRESQRNQDFHLRSLCPIRGGPRHIKFRYEVLLNILVHMTASANVSSTGSRYGTPNAALLRVLYSPSDSVSGWLCIRP